ncbi:MAG: Glu-tRNA(Gln) amidotransferase subunit GatD [Promethearchaeota archaeon]
MDIQITYRGKAAAKLKESKIKEWDFVQVSTPKLNVEGIVLPRPELGEDRFITIKLSTGYNVGIDVDNILSIKKIGHEKGEYKLPEKAKEPDSTKKRVPILGCGGTIASRLDYQTGAVIPALTPVELYSMVPELADIAFIEPRLLFELLSEDMQPENWVKISAEIIKEIEQDAQGIVLAHGTDTLGFTAAATAFLIQNLKIPLVFVGAQRSSDRPSSDAALNLIAGATVATKSDIAESIVSMHGHISDRITFVHRGTRVRKMHSSRRDAFRTMGDLPLAIARKGKLKLLRNDYNKRGSAKGEIYADTRIESKVALLYTYPGIGRDRVDSLIDAGYKGIVIAGTGLGHTPQCLFPAIERAIESEIPIVITTQCLNGFVGLNVYSNGRRLLNLGVIPGKNILPETALVKLMVILGRTQNEEEIQSLMLTNLAGEFSAMESYYAYSLIQGGVPETNNFLKKIWMD